MSEPKRPDPDALLRRIQAQSTVQSGARAGRLKIFLGANAGVGKTYRMLSQARVKKEEGVDVVVGIAETHGRNETKALLDGFEIIPQKKIEYGGIVLDEMDLDAILSRKPKLVLVDELAHTNVPGSRHPKRYQDVEEILNAGIDVYTTMNIQHVESLNDLVYQITGVRVQETVPDSMLEIARGPDEIELVDLTPQELLQRMRDGKVYVPEKAKQASERFFQIGNLIALREMALRFVARRVDEDMRTYMEENAIQGPWGVSTRILVCVGSSPLSEQVIRLAKQLATGIDAEWFAVHVQSPLQRELSEKAQDRLTRNLQLAESLGGKVSVLTGHSVAEQILAYARANNISFILAGWTPRLGWKRMFRGSLVNTLVRESGPIHVMVVTGTAKKSAALPPAAPRPLDRRKIGWSAALVAAATGLGLVAEPWLNFVNIAMLLLLPVVATGSWWGMQAGLTSSILSVLVLDFFFVAPRFSFAITDLRYLPTFLVFFLIGITTSFLSDQVRSQGEDARRSEQFISSLYDLSAQLLAVNNTDDLLQSAGNTISRAFNCEVDFLLPDGIGNLQVRARVCPTGIFDEHDWGVADWAFQHGEPAGRGTETLPSAKFRYIPLKRKKDVVGVLAVNPLDSGRPLRPDQLHLLDAFANISAVALARLLRLR